MSLSSDFRDCVKTARAAWVRKEQQRIVAMDKWEETLDELEATPNDSPLFPVRKQAHMDAVKQLNIAERCEQLAHQAWKEGAALL